MTSATQRDRACRACASMLTASCAGGGTPVAEVTPSPVEGALGQGLIAYVAGNGVGGARPGHRQVDRWSSPLPAGGAFRIAGPVWAPAPGIDYPVLYFTIHDDRPAEQRTTPGVVPYDWLFRRRPVRRDDHPAGGLVRLPERGPLRDRRQRPLPGADGRMLHELRGGRARPDEVHGRDQGDDQAADPGRPLHRRRGPRRQRAGRRARFRDRRCGTGSTSTPTSSTRFRSSSARTTARSPSARRHDCRGFAGPTTGR